MKSKVYYKHATFYIVEIALRRKLMHGTF